MSLDGAGGNVGKQAEWESELTVNGPEGFHQGDKDVLKLDCGDGCVTH